MRIVVDLPDPLGPRNPVTVPGRTSNDRSSTATTLPKRLESPRASITGSALHSAQSSQGRSSSNPERGDASVASSPDAIVVEDWQVQRTVTVGVGLLVSDQPDTCLAAGNTQSAVTRRRTHSVHQPISTAMTTRDETTSTSRAMTSTSSAGPSRSRWFFRRGSFPETLNVSPLELPTSVQSTSGLCASGCRCGGCTTVT